MAKLQKIVRVNKSVNYSVNIPQDIIETVGWVKGDNIDIGSINLENDEIIVVLRRKD